MKKMIMAGLVATLAGLGTAVWAGPGEGRGEGPGPMEGKMEGKMGPGKEHDMGGRILQRLLDNPDKAKEFGLTEEQLTALQASHLEFEKKMVALQGEVELAQIEMRQLMKADQPDEAAIMAAIDKLGLARTAVQKAGVTQRLAVRNIVGPETMKKIQGMVGERLHQARGEGRGEGMREGKGGPDAPWKKGPMAPPSEE